MLLKLSVKYNLRLENYIPVDYLRLVKAILIKYDPVNVSSATTLMEDYQYRERELLKVLNRKYNSDFNEIIISIYTTASPEQPPIDVIETKSSFSQKLNFSEINFFQKLKPKIYILSFIGVAIIIVTLIIVFNHKGSRNRTIDSVKNTGLSQKPAPVNVPITETSQNNRPAADTIINEPTETKETTSKQTMPVNPYGPGNGKMTIFKTCDNPEISISIDGNYIGKLSQTFNASSTPQCDAYGTISKILASGRHHISGEDSIGTSWDMMVFCH